MTELVACLHRGTIEVLRAGHEPAILSSPYLAQLASKPSANHTPRIVSVTRGRKSGELCYALSSGDACHVFTQSVGTSEEQRLFHGVPARVGEVDFSPADEALACSVEAADGTSAIGMLKDDGKGLRTVTEGDVIDRAPRWAPGGRAEILYASSGIGRTKTGKAVGRSPFALHRLRFSDNSVEVLVADAHYDYVAVVPASQEVLYALRRPFVGNSRPSPFADLLGHFRKALRGHEPQRTESTEAHDLVRITSKGSQLVAREVLAFDVGENEALVYATRAGVFRVTGDAASPTALSALDCVEQLVIYW